MSTGFDISPYIKAKSDQLNADDLLGGPITVQVVAVKQGKEEQPVSIKLSGGHMDFRPCKTMRRVLAAAWGPHTGAWLGRWMTLYRDSNVTFGADAVGGIRISALSHIDRNLTLSLTSSRGRKSQWKVKRLDNPSQQGRPTANLDALLGDEELTRDDVDRWRTDAGKPVLADLTDDQVAQLAGWLSGNDDALNAIRALIPAAEGAAPTDSTPKEG